MLRANHVLVAGIFWIASCKAVPTGSSSTSGGELEAGLTTYRERVAELLPTFLEDRAVVASLPFFAPAGRKSDAGPFLNSRVGWVGDEEAIRRFQARSGVVSPSLALPANIRSALSGDESDWASIAKATDVDALDFAWMAELAKFDHWDLDTNSPREDMSPYDFYRAPIPGVLDLRIWARLRLAHAGEGADREAALREVRQLAWLCGTTESLFSVGVGLSIAQMADEWSSAARDLKDYDRAHRYLKATSRLLSVALEPATLSKVIDWTAPGICSGGEVALVDAYDSRPALGRELAPAYERLQQALDDPNSPCRWTQIRQAWNERASKKRFSDHAQALIDLPRGQQVVAVKKIADELGMPAVSNESALEFFQRSFVRGLSDFSCGPHAQACYVSNANRVVP